MLNMPAAASRGERSHNHAGVRIQRCGAVRSRARGMHVFACCWPAWMAALNAGVTDPLGITDAGVRGPLGPPPVARRPAPVRSWSMVVPTLTRRADAAGIAPRYRDWRGQQVAVSAGTLTPILDALDNVPGASQEPAPGRPRHAEEPAGPDGPDAAARPRAPGPPSWVRA